MLFLRVRHDFQSFSITVDNAFVNISAMTELSHHLLPYVGSNASVLQMLLLMLHAFDATWVLDSFRGPQRLREVLRHVPRPAAHSVQGERVQCDGGLLGAVPGVVQRRRRRRAPDRRPHGERRSSSTWVPGS
jgi:hypothetical protein